MSTLTDLFAGIATAIRSKTGSSESIQAAQFAQAISAIPEGATVTVGTAVVSNGGDLQFPAGAANAIALLNLTYSKFNDKSYVFIIEAISGQVPIITYAQWYSNNNAIGVNTSNATYTPETGVMHCSLSGWKGERYTMYSW